MTDRSALLNSLLRGGTDKAEEAQVLTILQQADTDELNALLEAIDIDELFDSVDNRIIGPDNRSRLIQLLARDRLAELTLENAAGVVHGLQDGRTNREDETAIRDVFLHFRGIELTALKNQLNMFTDDHDLEGLVFDDVDNDALRSEILVHIDREARDLDMDEAKVLSDIDDTVVCAIHDKRYPKGIIYPGVLALFEALDRGPSATPASMGDLTFLTARPSDAFGLMERHTRESLRKAGVATSSVMLGSLFNLHTKDAMAGKKLANVDHYRLLFPEYHLVFIGDSGQGDVKVGHGMYQAHPGAVRAVFIHDVVATPDDKRAEWAAERIYFVDTYVGAATKALELGLISRDGLDHVIAETVRDADRIAWSSPEQEQATRALIERDIAAAGE